MNARWILSLLAASLLVMSGVATAGSAEDDLKFAQQLGIRGLDKMANKVLTDMVKSRDPEAQRLGRYGQALITKQQAQIAAARYIRALENSTTPPIRPLAINSPRSRGTCVPSNPVNRSWPGCHGDATPQAYPGSFPGPGR